MYIIHCIDRYLYIRSGNQLQSVRHHSPILNLNTPLRAAKYSFPTSFWISPSYLSVCSSSAGCFLSLSSLCETGASSGCICLHWYCSPRKRKREGADNAFDILLLRTILVQYFGALFCVFWVFCTILGHYSAYSEYFAVFWGVILHYSAVFWGAILRILSILQYFGALFCTIL